MGLQTSRSTNSKRGTLRRCSMFAIRPVSRLSKATTAYPSRSSASHRCDPRKPAGYQRTSTSHEFRCAPFSWIEPRQGPPSLYRTAHGVIRSFLLDLGNGALVYLSCLFASLHLQKEKVHFIPLSLQSSTQTHSFGRKALFRRQRANAGWQATGSR